MTRSYAKFIAAPSFARALLLAGSLLFAGTASAATVSLEIAAAGRQQITAPREWLQLLAQAGVTQVRVRGQQRGDKPTINTVDTGAGQLYQVVGVLATRDKLMLPGETFTRRDVARLRDYFDRLKKDGPQRLTTDTGNYGLTRQEFEAVFRDLGQGTIFTTKDLKPEQLITKAGKSCRYQLHLDKRARAILSRGKPIGDELGELTIGATLAIALRRDGLVLVPEKPRGAAPLYRVTSVEGIKESWPIGYKPEARPREVAPSLMQRINVEIDGFTLTEAMGAITPRLDLPVLWDHASLAKHKIDPAKIDVFLPRANLSYKRILEKLLFQARLRGELRVDEVGTAFYWVTKER